MSKGTYDAVIVGARVAGAATGLLLARAGARVLLVDREAEIGDTLSTHALMRPAVELLAGWGLLPELLRAGTPWVRQAQFQYGVRPHGRPDPGYRRSGRADRAAALAARLGPSRRRRSGGRRSPAWDCRHRLHPRRRWEGRRRHPAGARRQAARDPGGPGDRRGWTRLSDRRTRRSEAPRDVGASRDDGLRLLLGHSQSRLPVVFRKRELGRRYPDQRRPALRLRRLPAR